MTIAHPIGPSQKHHQKYPVCPFMFAIDSNFAAANAFITKEKISNIMISPKIPSIMYKMYSKYSSPLPIIETYTFL